jgi:hypothetical protein
MKYNIIVVLFALFLSACAPQDIYICTDETCQLNSCENIDSHIICTPKDSPIGEDSITAVRYHLPSYNAKYGICVEDVDYADIYMSQDGGSAWDKISSDGSVRYDYEMINGRKIHWLNIGQPYGEIKMELHKSDSSIEKEFNFSLQYKNIFDVDNIVLHYEGGIVKESCQ